MNKKQIAQINEALTLKKESGEMVSKALKQDGFKNEPDLLKMDVIQPYQPPTRRTAATVKIMLSYDYCHFEESITLTGENIQLHEIDDARKDVQRLCDKAVGQYKTAKEIAAKNINNPYERPTVAAEVAALKRVKEELLTPDEKAKIKAYDDYIHNSRYFYDDDEQYNFPIQPLQ